MRLLNDWSCGRELNTLQNTSFSQFFPIKLLLAWSYISWQELFSIKPQWQDRVMVLIWAFKSISGCTCASDVLLPWLTGLYLSPIYFFFFIIHLLLAFPMKLKGDRSSGGSADSDHKDTGFCSPVRTRKSCGFSWGGLSGPNNEEWTEKQSLIEPQSKALWDRTGTCSSTMNGWYPAGENLVYL